MKNKSHIISACLTILFVSLSTLSLNAETWYLQASQGSSHTWGNLTDGTSCFWMDGAGNALTSLSASEDTFDLNGKTLRTHRNAFSAGSLTMGSSKGTLALKAATSILTNDLLITGGGIINHGMSTGTAGAVTFAINGELQINTGTTLAITTDATSNATYYMTLTAGAISGAGEITVTSKGSNSGLHLTLSSENARNYTGRITVSKLSTLVFKDSFHSGATAALNEGSFLSLNGDITLGGLTIAGTALQLGKKYTIDELTRDYGAYFAVGSSGSITIGTLVPEPASIALLLAGLVVTVAMIIRQNKRELGA